MRLKPYQVFLGIFLSVSFFAVKAQNVNVSPITGAVQADIPLWALQDRSIRVPVILSYYSSGARAGLSEGNAGVGWNISGAGGVYRELRGLPDDYRGEGNDLRKGWLVDKYAAVLCIARRTCSE